MHLGRWTEEQTDRQMEGRFYEQEQMLTEGSCLFYCDGEMAGVQNPGEFERA